MGQRNLARRSGIRWYLLALALLVYTAMWLLFPEAGCTPALAFHSFTTVSGELTNLFMAAAVLGCWQAGRAELEAMLERFRSATHQLVWDGQPVTCSVGAAPVTPSEPLDALYQAADRLLYDAKTRGRDRYVIGS